MAYTIDRLITDADFETVDARVRKALVDAGFGVLTEIDVAATMKKKLDVDIIVWAPAIKVIGPVASCGEIGTKKVSARGESLVLAELKPKPVITPIGLTASST